MSSPAANISFHFKVVYKILRVFLSFLQHYSPAPHQFVLYCILMFSQKVVCMQLVNQYMQSTTQQNEMSLHIINNVYIHTTIVVLHAVLLYFHYLIYLVVVIIALSSFFLFFFWGFSIYRTKSSIHHFHTLCNIVAAASVSVSYDIHYSFCSYKFDFSRLAAISAIWNIC